MMRIESQPDDNENLTDHERIICWRYHNALAEWHRDKANKHLGQLALNGVIPLETYGDIDE